MFYKIQKFMSTYTTNMEYDIYDTPIIIGATGIVAKGLKENMEVIPGKHSIDSLQKTAILGTSHTVWTVLQSET